MRRLLYYINKYDYDLPSPFEDGLPFEVTAKDGVRIAGTEIPGNGDYSFLVVHGLFAHHRAPGFAEFAQSLTRFGRVFAFDLRGHGLSSGVCTLGNLEALDVAAVTQFARDQTERPLVTIGFSMGAAAVVRAAALYEHADAVVSVSGPAQWGGPRRRSAELVSLAWKAPLARNIVKKVIGVSLARTWEPSESPASVVGKIAPSPLLIIHAADDDFFPPEEPEVLLDYANEPKELWMMPRGGHAEGLFSKPGFPVEVERVDNFVDEIVSRVSALMRRGSS